jgi:hypothetical protein
MVVVNGVEISRKPSAGLSILCALVHAARAVLASIGVISSRSRAESLEPVSSRFRTGLGGKLVSPDRPTPVTAQNCGLTLPVLQ